MNERSIPKATLGRLPQYLYHLKNLPDDEKYTSATAIARNLGLGEVQVRKDLAAVSNAGKPKIGYLVTDLLRDVESCLGFGRLTEAVLVGAGKLGRALLGYGGFEEYGVKIVAAFDVEESIVLTGQSEIKVRPVEEMESFCRQRDIKLGIITVGKDAAQAVCDQLVQSGIRAIWNFAPCSLKTPEGVILKRENLALSLAHLSSLL